MSYGQVNVDYERRVDIERMSRQRVEKVNAGLKKYGLGGILTLDSANIRYIVGSRTASGLPGVRGDYYALLCEGVEPIYFASVMTEGFPLPKPSHWWMKDMVRPGITSGASSPIELPEPYELQLNKFANQIKDELKAHGKLSETLGVVPDSRPQVGALEKAGIKIDTKSASKMMRECREIKTVDEVECLRMACSISDACTMEVWEAIKPGVTERQLAGIAARKAYEMGAEDLASFHIESGLHTWPNYGQTTDKAIRFGDLLYGEIAVVYMGYRNCYYTGTFSCGRPTQAQKDAWVKARDWTRTWAKAARPGGTTKDIAEAMPRNEEFGWPAEDYDLSNMMQWVHGIGLTTPEWPSISRGWSLKYPYPIKEDMCLAVEAICPTGEASPEYPNGQAVRLEDDFHLTADGIDWLTKIPRDEIMVCPLT